MGADGPLSSEGGSPRRASVDNANVPVCRSFSSAWSRNECLEHVQRVSRDVARARECPPVPKSTRLVPARNQNLAFAGNTVCPFAGLLCKPSDGLEPSTPSLPWNDSGNRSQPTATVFACLGRFRGRAVCQRLPRVATAGLHKGSTFSCLCWLRRPQLDISVGWSVRYGDAGAERKRAGVTGWRRPAVTMQRRLSAS